MERYKGRKVKGYRKEELRKERKGNAVMEEEEMKEWKDREQR